MSGNASDRRRIAGPETTYPIQYEPITDDAGLSEQKSDTSRIKPIFLQTGFIDQANGSAFLETEDSKIICSVYGPRQASRNIPYSESATLNVEVKFAPFSSEQRRAAKDTEDAGLSNIVLNSLSPAIRLDLFPKSTIDVFIVVLQNNGIEVCAAASTVAACAAVADAGIEMLGLVTSCAVSATTSGFILDPSKQETRMAHGTVVVACMPAVNTVTNVWQKGRLSVAQATRCIAKATSHCDDVHQVLAQALRTRSKLVS